MLRLAKARLFSRKARAMARAASASGWLEPDAVFHFGDAEREEVGLDCGGAVELPGGVDQGLNELGFGSLFGPIFVEEGMGMTLVGSVILGGKDDGLAC